MLTLPDNVLAWLRTIHPDPAWAIVSLFEAHQTAGERRAPKDEIELVQLTGKRALIVVSPALLKNVEGASMIPLADGRALIALDPHRGAADLELAIVDRLQRVPGGSREHEELTRLCESLRRWRRIEGLRFHTRSIIVVERAPAGYAIRPLGSPARPAVAARRSTRGMSDRRRA